MGMPALFKNLIISLAHSFTKNRSIQAKVKKLELTYDTVGVRFVTRRAKIEVWGKRRR